MKKALIGIGTNIGDRKQNITAAVNALNGVPMTDVCRMSSVYETAPWGFTEQRSFYNCVCEVDTELSPEALLGVCLGIEAGMGRVREFKNGPRIIDLDLLVYENENRDTPELTLPHPRIGERDFVLVPLKELFPAYICFGFDFEKSYEAIIGESTAKAVTE